MTVSARGRVAKAIETKISGKKAFAEVSDQLSFEFYPYDGGGSLFRSEASIF